MKRKNSVFVVQGVVLATIFIIGISIMPGYVWGGGKSHHHSHHGKSHHGNYGPWYRHHYGYYPHPGYGNIFFDLPSNYFFVNYRGGYYYYNGIFYQRRHHGGYVVVAPPIGVIVNAPPSYCEVITIGGVSYYVDNGIYYRHTYRGYEVVPTPVTTVVQPAVSSAVPAAPVQGSTDAFTVNIPNTSGGYTPVVLKREKEGFIGPQGEFYSEFPSVEQLKAMYGKGK